MYPLKQIAELVNGRLQGDPAFPIIGVNTLEKAGHGEIAFVARGHSVPQSLTAGALIVERQSSLSHPNLIYVDEPYLAISRVLELFHPRQRFNEGVSPHAWISPEAVLGKNVSVGPFSTIGPGCQIGDRSEIHAGVTIYRQVCIGADSLIYSGTVIRENVEIGHHVIIQPGVVIGADGFGFTRLANGQPVKIPQVGRVIIGDYCEIGANTCIDRSTIDTTQLQEYVKLDNLVQVGHNVTIGKNTAISAQTGISGSTVIGSNVIMGGQVGIADHIAIADGVMIAARAGIGSSIKKRMIVGGVPAVEMSRWRRNVAIANNLEELRDRIIQLEKKIKELEEK